MIFRAKYSKNIAHKKAYKSTQFICNNYILSLVGTDFFNSIRLPPNSNVAC